MNGYIVEKYNDMNNAYTSRRLMEEARGLSITLDVIGVRDTYEYNGILYNKGQRVEKRDFSINRSKEGHIIEKLGRLTEKQYNSIEQIKSFGDKSIQLERISSRHMRLPKYVLSNLEAGFNDIAELTGLPFVVKSLRGSQGSEVYLIQNTADYEELRRSRNGAYGEFIFEEYIKESSGRDIRVYCIRGEVLACMKRIAKNGFKANYALGGDVEPHKADSTIMEIVRDIYKATSLSYAGLDLLLGRDGYVFCEVNVTPGIEGIEKASGINVAREFMHFIRDSS